VMLNRSVRCESDSQTTDADNRALVQLVRTLDNAYRNAVTHETANPDSETADLLLENASIRLPSRMLSPRICPPGLSPPTRPVLRPRLRGRVADRRNKSFFSASMAGMESPVIAGHLQVSPA
jgi:hypothetical protein